MLVKSSPNRATSHPIASLSPASTARSTSAAAHIASDHTELLPCEGHRPKTLLSNNPPGRHHLPLPTGNSKSPARNEAFGSRRVPSGGH